MPDHVQVRCERLHDAFVLIHILPCASHLRYVLLHQARAVVLLPVLVLPVFVLLTIILLPVFALLLPVLVQPVVVVAAVEIRVLK